MQRTTVRLPDALLEDAKRRVRFTDMSAVVVDSSALLANLFDEPEATPMVHALEATRERYVVAPTLAEAGMVVFACLGADSELALDALLQRLSARIIAMTPAAATATATAARVAFRRYGKGVGTPAVLNFGDCLCYGVARSMRLPVLCKGDDFPQTDLALLPY